jgi:hypothetical protein
MNEQEIVLGHRQNLFPCVFHLLKEPFGAARAEERFACDESVPALFREKAAARRLSGGAGR